MKILIAEDEAAFRHLLEETLARWGYEVVVARDGNEAWQVLQAKDAPQLAILDWVMPGVDGVEICRKVRAELKEPYTYLILLTGRRRDEDLVAGLEAGADDYITKPFNAGELRARLKAGRRIVELQNELMAANTELEAFNFTVAQDLRKPLKLINSYCAVLRQRCGDRLDDRSQDYLREVHNHTMRMSRLIGTLLNFSRTTRSELNRQPVDLSALAREAAEELKQTEPQRGGGFRIAEGIGTVGDPTLLRVVLDNLLGNAWKFTARRDEARIEFGVTELGGRPVYFVRDNGIGFNMLHAYRLFIPFESLPGAEEFKGSGIGLATVERIVQRHGGRIWAEGDPGKGATFYFTLSSPEYKA